MVTRNEKWTSISGCTNKIKQQDETADGAGDGSSTISTDNLLSAVPAIDELAQYYGQGYEIPAELKTPLLEDDYDHDVHFDSFPPLPMAAQDPEQLVIYVSTLSKLIFPGARLGFMAVPAATLPWFIQMKAFTSRVNETLASRAVALWIQDGGFERHLRRLRRIYRERRDHLLERLTAQAFFRDQCAFIAPLGGMNLWLDIGCHPGKIVEKARQQGLLLSGEHLYLTADRRHEARHLRLGYAAHDEREMKKGLGILQKILQEENPGTYVQGRS